ncbi:MAG: adenylate/guanylate cyclase domain-containing protein [Mycobacterium sp.]
MGAAATLCERCGTALRTGARFCDACGARVAVTEGTAEYKQVTVLFADVVRSMEIAATLGAERLREIMSELLNQCAAVVQRFGGTLNSFTGDGVMALFGAPIALEDHAFRACLAALDIQNMSKRLAAEVEIRDKIALQLRVGLNSGEVIAGEISSRPMRYTVVGEQVGMAQRMESVAPPGGVMVSESTARLIDGRMAFGPPEMVRIKGAGAPVPARRLLGIATDPRVTDRRESSLIGRAFEKNAIVELMDRSLRGDGIVVGFVGSPGIGKSRLTRETAALASRRGFEVFLTYCESHSREIPFHVLARLLRTVFGVSAVSAEVARSRLRAQLPRADADDLLLLDDLLGIRDTATSLPDISPDARRRRLTALVNAATVERRTPALYVIEDAHWIDDVSESMLFEFVSVIRETRSMVVVTYRPEYQGLLTDGAGAQVLELAPLDDLQRLELTRELLGTDTFLTNIVATVAERAAGNPFFTEEIVRDLAERGVLRGQWGQYVCVDEVADISVPATLQATLGARIDRLSPTAKRTLHAAAVIGARFDAELLTQLFDGAELSSLIDAELVEHVSTSPRSEYAFRHPLIQKVAYESQLKSTRSALHRRLATAIEQDETTQGDENAAFIATHWEAAGDLRAAFIWHMRAGEWFNYRDVRAARTSWRRAQQVADHMAEDEPDRWSMRISPRTLLCGSTFRVGLAPAHTGFDELRDLAIAAHDDVSLAIGMAGQLTTLAFHSHYREAVEMASELEDLVDSIGDPTLMIALLYAAAQAKWEAGLATECRRLVQRVIDLADGDPTRGNVMLASPLAWALSLRGAAGLSLGRPDWNFDVEQGIALAAPFDATARVVPTLYKYAVGITNGALLSDDSAALHTAALLKVAEQSGDDTAVALARLNRAVVLARIDDEKSYRVLDMLDAARSALAHTSDALRRIADVEIARETARQGDVERAVALARLVLDEYYAVGDMIARGPATALLVELLLRRMDNGDLEAAEAAVDRLAAVSTEPGFVLHEPQLLRLSALLAGAHNQDSTYQDFVERYRTFANSLGFEGHTAIALSM